MKVLFIFPYPSGTAASQRFRFEQYLPLLKQRGIEYRLAPFMEEATWKILYKKGHAFQKITGILKGFLKRFFLLGSLHQFDFVFIHREVAPLFPSLFEWMVAKIFRKKIIFDFDDAIWIPNTSEQNSWIAGLKFHSKTASIIRNSYKVSAGNPYLADYALQYNPQVVVMPTTIDTLSLHNPALYPSKNPSRINIGWTGTHSTLMYLERLIPLIAVLEKQYEFNFIVIADKNPGYALSSFRFIPWNIATEMQDLLLLDIGLMPLLEDPWSLGKCGFKALQYMALEIPALVSPIGVNAEMVAHGKTGFHCLTDQDWLDSMAYLIENPSQIRTMGRAARQFVEDHYSVQANQEKFLSLFGED